MRDTRLSHHMRFNFITQIIFQDQGKPRQLCLVQLPSSVKKNESKIVPQTLPEKPPGGFTSTKLHKE